MSDQKRLHPVAIFLLFFSSLKELILPFIAAFFFGREAESIDFPYTVYFVCGFFFLLSLYGYLKWLTYTYEVNKDELKIRQGVFIKKQRFIRRERIHSIDISAGVLQRMFHLVAVKIETAGGGNDPEVKLSAVTKQEAQLIKKQLLEANETSERAKPDMKEKFRLQWKLSNTNLFYAALTSSGIGIAFMAIMALVSQIEKWFPDRYMTNYFGYLFETSLFYSGIVVMVVFFISWFISIISMLFKYGNFRIEKKGDVLQITRGILKERQLTLSISRITAVRVVESILRQPLGFATVFVESAGGGSKDEQLSTVLIPLVHRKELIKYLDEVIPMYAFDHQIEKLPKRARSRYIFRVLVPGIIIAGFISYFMPYGILGASIVILVAILFGNQQYKDAGFGKNENFLLIANRGLSKTLVIIPKQRIQALEMKQSMMQKLKKLFTIQASILSSVIGKSFQSVDVSEKQKEEVAVWYSFEE